MNMKFYVTVSPELSSSENEIQFISSPPHKAVIRLRVKNPSFRFIVLPDHYNNNTTIKTLHSAENEKNSLCTSWALVKRMKSSSLRKLCVGSETTAGLRG